MQRSSFERAIEDTNVGLRRTTLRVTDCCAESK